jgi:hypothetical protein
MARMQVCVIERLVQFEHDFSLTLAVYAAWGSSSGTESGVDGEPTLTLTLYVARLGVVRVVLNSAYLKATKASLFCLSR